MPQGGKKVSGALDRVAGDAERLREMDEVGIAELRAERAAELSLLVDLDHAAPLVDEDDDDDRRDQARCCLQLLDVHEEATIAAERDDLAVGMDELRCDRSWERDAHRSYSVRVHDGGRTFRG